MDERPDILLVVLDCVSSEAYAKAAEPLSKLPGLDRVSKSGVTFTGAVSPSPWSLPAHASLFSGLYPWEHGIIGRGSVPEPAFLPAAEVARRSGYSTAAFSSNQYVFGGSPLAAGFQVVHSGRFDECAYRRPIENGHGRDGVPSGDGTPEFPFFSYIAEAAQPVKRLARGLVRVAPPALDSSVRVWAKLTGADSPARPLVSPWIEARVKDWLRGEAGGGPIMMFVNYMDAHEPYPGLPPGPKGLRDLLRVWRAIGWDVRRGQGHKVPPSPEVLETLRELYHAAIRIADQRLTSLLDILADHRDPDNLVTILVGDHGQSFGGGGAVFHGSGQASELYRVPLVAQHPSLRAGARAESRWISTKEVGHWIARIAAGEQVESVIGFQPDPGEDTAPQAWALNLGPSLSSLESNGRLESSRWNEAELICFSGEREFIISPAAGSLRSVAIKSENPTVTEKEETPTAAVIRAMASRIAEVLGKTMSAPRGGPISDRLAGWGY